MPREKVLNLLSKAKIFQEVSFCQVLQFLEIKLALLQQTELIKSGSSLADTNSDSESKKILVEQKIFSGFKD